MSWIATLPYTRRYIKCNCMKITVLALTMWHSAAQHKIRNSVDSVCEATLEIWCIIRNRCLVTYVTCQTRNWHWPTWEGTHSRSKLRTDCLIKTLSLTLKGSILCAIMWQDRPLLYAKSIGLFHLICIHPLWMTRCVCPRGWPKLALSWGVLLWSFSSCPGDKLHCPRW